jgi:ATP-binding cassette, subfamily C, bacterial
VQTAPRILHTLSRFSAALISTFPRRATETIVVTLILSATEGIGLLLLIPLLQLVGVGNTPEGALGGGVAMLGAAFRTVGLPLSLGGVLAVYVGTIWLQSLLQRRAAVLNAVVQYEIVTTLHDRVYRAIAGSKWIYFVRTRSSDYAQVLTSEIDRVGAAAYYLIDLFVTAAVSVVYLGFAFRVSPTLTAIVAACGASLAFTLRGKISEGRSSGEAASAASRRYYAAVSEHLASLKIAKSYAAEAQHARTFARLSRELNDISVVFARSHARFRQQLSVAAAALLAIIVYVAYTVLDVPTEQLLLLLFLFARLVPRLTGIYDRAQVLAAELPAFDVVSQTEQRCLAEAEPAADTMSTVELNDLIAFDRVTFDYAGDGQRLAVDDVTLAIAAGKTTAIVGPSGAGKSTVADLLMGLLTPSNGQLLVDGRPLGVGHLAAWRHRIGYVTQDTFLFHDTVRANLVWANPDASEDDLWRALRLASADEFVADLPGGLDTVLGDRGVLLSGGERQRLSLARALLRRPTLLILDEATSSLDSENETRIQRAIDSLHHQMTIVIITHRLSTIRRADLIHVIDRGRLIESGAWDELMSRPDGRFRELCLAQGMDQSHALAAGGPADDPNSEPAPDDR